MHAVPEAAGNHAWPMAGPAGQLLIQSLHWLLLLLVGAAEPCSLGRRSFFTTTDEEQWQLIRKGTAQAFSQANIRWATTTHAERQFL